MVRCRLAFGLLAALVLIACGESEPATTGPDAGTTRPDVGFMDAAVSDAAAADAAVVDADVLPGPVIRERSLVWTQPAIVETSTTISLARVMAATSDDGHGGRLFDWLLRRFGTTPYSIRTDQSDLADEMKMDLGADPSTWDLALAPFIVTAVHNRIDLASAGHCGELRVSFSTTHPIIRPFHLIALFQMRPEPGDPDCRGLAIRLARLSELSERDFVEAAAELIAETVMLDRFIVLESAEFTFSPWEWRQWARVANTDPTTMADLPFVFENPPMFQTVDIPALNPPGPLREQFLTWVAANAADIDRRQILIPEVYRPKHATAPAAIPRETLTLAGLDPTVRARYPNLRKNLEIVGCPACHTADADFVHTTETRDFSDFYDKELDARKVHLDALVQARRRTVPFGPLQPDPVLPD